MHWAMRGPSSLAGTRIATWGHPEATAPPLFQGTMRDRPMNIARPSSAQAIGPMTT